MQHLVTSYPHVRIQNSPLKLSLHRKKNNQIPNRGQAERLLESATPPHVGGLSNHKHDNSKSVEEEHGPLVVCRVRGNQVLVTLTKANIITDS